MPLYPHNADPGTATIYLGGILIEGKEWDCYSYGKGYGVLFRWGPEGADYYAGPVHEFPLDGPSRKHYELHPCTQTLNKAWKMVKRRWW